FTPVVLALILLLIFIVAFFYYRNTIPFLSRGWKIFLSTVRSLALILILLAIGEITFGITKFFRHEPKTLFLIDNSKSVGQFYNENQSKVKPLLTLLNSKLNEDKGKYESFTFSDKISKNEVNQLDSIMFDGSATNISSALNSISEKRIEKNIQNIILITDGIYNSGDKPLYSAEKLGIPIFTIGIGNPLQQKDIIVSELLSNDITYVQNLNKVKAYIKNFSFARQKIDVSLYEENVLIERKNLSLSENFDEINFDYTPKIIGERKLTVTISNVEKEQSIKNNSLSKYINVLSDKLNILLIAGSPSNDFGFIKNLLESNQSYRVNGLIENQKGGFYPLFSDKRNLDSADILFFIGFPESKSSFNFINEIKSKVVEKNLPILFLVNNQTDFNLLNIFNDYLPFTVGNSFGDVSQVFFDISSNQTDNAILKIDDVNNAQAWNSFPPIFRVDREFKAKPESEILSYFKIQNNRINQPLLLTRKLNQHRSIALLGFGIWRLKLLNSINTEQNDKLDRLLNNIVKWLNTREVTKKLKVKLAKKIFDKNENILISAQLYDDSNNPVSDQNISLDIFQNRQLKFSTVFQSLGNGLYQAEINDLDKGDYSYTASVTLLNQKYSDEGKFSVSETELEYQNLRMDEDLLKQIASINGGKYFSLDQADDFINNLEKNLKQKVIEKAVTSENQLWNSAYFLIAVIVLLSIEWFFRKRLGLL
ncbi:MAG: hypothetical protein N3A61_08195, partial [Ignavibacteria bacterium]|nr:hypothetical protein [Ignavibacteria bacterium]